MADENRSTEAGLAVARARTVVLCRPGDEDLAIAWELRDPTGGFEQSADDDSVPYIVITPSTSDEKCARLGERFGVEASRLIKFRDTPTLKRSVVLDARHG